MVSGLRFRVPGSLALCVVLWASLLPSSAGASTTTSAGAPPQIAGREPMTFVAASRSLQRVTISTPKSVLRGRAVAVKGKVSPARPRAIVRLQTWTGSGWVTTASARTNRDSRYRFSTRPVSGSTARIRVVAPGTSKVQRDVSPVRVIRLRTSGSTARLRPGTLVRAGRQVQVVTSLGDGAYRVRLASGVAAPKIGKALVLAPRAGLRNGFIGVVTSRKIVQGKWLVVARLGGLADAYSDLTLSARVTPRLATATASNAGAGFKDSNSSLTTPQVQCAVGSAMPSLSATPDVSKLVYDVVLDLRSRTFLLNVAGSATLKVSASAPAKFDCSLSWPVVERVVGKVGPVPIVATFGPKVSLGSNSPVNVSQTFAGRLGLTAQASKNRLAVSVGSSGTASNPTVTVGAAQTTFEAQVGVELGLSLGEVAGVSATAGYKVELARTSGFSPDPCTTLQGMFHGSLDAGGRAFGVVGWSFTLAERDFGRRQLWTSCGPITPPPPPPPAGGNGIPAYVTRQAGPAGFASGIGTTGCPVPPAGMWSGLIATSTAGAGWQAGSFSTDGTPVSIVAFGVGTDPFAEPGTYVATVRCVEVPEGTDNLIEAGNAQPARTSYSFVQTVTETGRSPSGLPVASSIGASVTIGDGGGCGVYAQAQDVLITMGARGVGTEARVSADDNGRWGPVTIAVPDAGPGDYWVNATCYVRDPNLFDSSGLWYKFSTFSVPA